MYLRMGKEQEEGMGGRERMVGWREIRKAGLWVLIGGRGSFPCQQSLRTQGKSWQVELKGEEGTDGKETPFPHSTSAFQSSHVVMRDMISKVLSHSKIYCFFGPENGNHE